MFSRLTRPLLALAGAVACALAGTPTAPAWSADAAVERPRLVVVLSIDQFRADYLQRFGDLYLPPKSRDGVGGFRYLMSRGAWYPDCRFAYHRTATGPGHATLGTGAQPGLSGIVGNAWWNAQTGKSVYCVDDPNSKVVGALPGSRETPMSAANLLTTTVGDELELATGGRSKTVALSLKDRGSILLAGHRADTVLWFDEDTGAWISSSAYCPSGRLPGWVTALNDRKLPDSLRREPWVPSVDSAALRRVWPTDGKAPTFSHNLGGSSYGPFTVSPAGNDYVFQSAREAVKAEQLGQDEIPDILSLNLACNDYVGHRFGPDSAEVLDISVQTDRMLAEFLRFLNRAVPGGLSRVTFALSADHGVASVPELQAKSGVPASRAIGRDIAAAAEKALDAQIGAADWIASSENGELYFSPRALAAFPQVPRSRAQEIAAEAVLPVRGVFFAVGRQAALSGALPNTEYGRRIGRGVHPSRSGDVIVVLDPHWLPGSAATGTGTSHGNPFAYDAHVPMLLCGFGVRPGVYSKPVNPACLAPTLAYLVGTVRPSGAEEPLLPGLAGVTD
ncbi:MAG: alkaline phosphatase family protein [Armatimonadota bacterium]